jgi:hypothetical protein
MTDHLYVIDEIHFFGLKIFQRHLWPGHLNLMDYKPVLDYISVGVGPLNFSSEKHVKVGKPMKLLVSRDYRFMAEMEGVELPPSLPIKGHEENKLFNCIMKERTMKGKSANWDLMAEEFLKRADGKTIFPKLPQLLKSHYTTWKFSRLIKAFQELVKEQVKTIREKFLAQRVDPPRIQPKTSHLTAASSIMKSDITKKANFVPPPVCPGQKAQLPSHALSSKNRDSRMTEVIDLTVAPTVDQKVLKKYAAACANYPHCPLQARVCGVLLVWEDGKGDSSNLNVMWQTQSVEGNKTTEKSGLHSQNMRSNKGCNRQRKHYQLAVQILAWLWFASMMRHHYFTVGIDQRRYYWSVFKLVVSYKCQNENKSQDSSCQFFPF